METTKYVRRPFFVDQIQVTEENINDVAKWTNGDVRTDSDGKKYVKVRVYMPKSPRQSMAYIGDHVLYAGTGYKVYTHKAFEASFELAEDQNAKVSVSTGE